MSNFLRILFWLTLIAQPVLAGQMPDVLHISDAGGPYISEPGTRYPAWVAAERVLTPAGEVDASLFNFSDRFRLTEYLRRPADEGCIQLGPVELESIASDSPKARKSLASAAKSADWVFRAVVTCRAHGFNGSTPGTLLEIIPEETFKGPPDRGGAHYIFVPVGMFSVGGKRFCKTDPRYAKLPEIGERLFLMLDRTWQNQGTFLHTGDFGIVTIDKDGAVSLPKRYLETESWLSGGAENDLLGFIRRTVAEEN